MNDLVIRTLLDLSTAHLSEETCRTLNDYDGVTAYETPYGWLMSVPTRDRVQQLTPDGDWPPELLPIVELAQARGCAYVLFDRDASQTALLPTFDW